jgi:hypothetical protein
MHKVTVNNFINKVLNLFSTWEILFKSLKMLDKTLLMEISTKVCPFYQCRLKFVSLKPRL